MRGTAQMVDQVIQSVNDDYSIGFVTRRMRECLWFWRHVEVGEIDECWPWRKAISSEGYGYLTLQSKISKERPHWGAHRLAYYLTFSCMDQAKKDTKLGLHLHHICETKHCCNPFHLVLVNSVEHSRRHRIRNSSSTVSPQAPGVK